MADDTILQVTGITKSFDGVLAVDDVSFNVGRGEVLGIIGPNGSGKSTLINVITGFIRRSNGQVIFGGRDISRLAPHRVAGQGIARTFQVARPYYSLTVAQNLVVPLFSGRAVAALKGKRGGRRDAVYRLMEKVGLGDGKGIADTAVSALSLDSLKRLELARCLVLEPEIIICDELFSGLSIDEIDSISILIKKLGEGGITFIMVEHRFKELFKLAHRVLVMNFGRKIAEGRPEAVLQHDEVRRAYSGL